jgi:hypothetical protein
MRKFRTEAQMFLAGKRHARFLIMFLLGLSAFGGLLLTTADRANGEQGLLTARAVQNTVTGEWTAELNPRRASEIQMTFHRRSEQGGISMTSETLSVSELRGLSAEVASAGQTNVNFQLVREAGTFACEGYFRAGKGAGFWTLAPSQSFVSAMRARGYGSLTAEDLLRAALHNLTTKFIEELKAVGYDHPEFGMLLRAATHEVTPAFIREMQAAGYQGVSLEELVRARNHDINGQYVREVQGMGFDKQPLETLIRMRNHEITQGFISQMRAAGFDNLSIEELIRLKNHEITPEFVAGLKAEGYSDISAETAIRLKNHNVDRDFIRRVKARGLTNVTLDQLIRLRSQDIIN